MNRFFKTSLLLIFLISLSLTVVNAGNSSLNLSKFTDNPKFKYFEGKTTKEFVNKLNELGKLGYKLTIVWRYQGTSTFENPTLIQIAGVVELQEGDTFEYEWFPSITLEDFVEQFSPKAEKGFYFSQSLFFGLWKNPYENLPEVTAEKGTADADMQSIKRSIELIKRLTSDEPVIGSILILERKNKLVKPVNFKFATAIPVKSVFGTNVIDNGKINETIETSINEIDTRNYQPVLAFYSSAVFKTRVSQLPTILFQNKSDEISSEKPIYKVVGGNRLISSFRKEVDKLTKEGFSILTITSMLSLAVKNNRQTSYLWLEPQKKDFLQKLSEISKTGARFLTRTGQEMIFGKPINDDGQRFEYKVLNLKEMPSLKMSNTSIQEFNELINQGFKPCSLFYVDNMNILFERKL
jgi:hypothetical protein